MYLGRGSNVFLFELDASCGESLVGIPEVESPTQVTSPTIHVESPTFVHPRLLLGSLHLSSALRRWQLLSH